MAEAFACHLGVDATCEQVGGMGMPQIMVLPFPFLGVLLANLFRELVRQISGSARGGRQRQISQSDRVLE
jgi:hypothetical protein